MTIGDKIKKLRKDKDITQEKLPEYLNISYQAVSKWESGNGLPDISLVIPLSNFFGVSPNVLFDFDSKVQEEEINVFNKEYQILRNQGKLKEALTICKNITSKYPNNFNCLTKLAYILFDTAVTSPFNDENKSAKRDGIDLCERILQDCMDDEYRSYARQILTYFYKIEGNEEKAVETASKSISIKYSREILLSDAYDERNVNESTKQRSSNNIRFMDYISRNITLTKYNNTDDKIFAYNSLITLWKTLIYDENFLFYHTRLATIYQLLAQAYAKNKDTLKVFESLESAKKHAIAYDSLLDGEHEFTSLFVYNASVDKSDSTKNYSFSDLELLKRNIADSCFDFLRQDDDFIKFEKSL